jgi:hypothetical protein
MIHDTLEERQEVIKFLKSLGLYSEYLSAEKMQWAHTIYWSMKENDDTGLLKPCPFCGEVPEFPSGEGTQYGIQCEECGMACASVQICDLMTQEERESETFENFTYGAEYIERAKQEVIKQWNDRK